MNFSEALIQLELGNDITRELWKDQIDYMYLDCGNRIFLRLTDGLYEECKFFTVEAIFAKDYSVVSQ